MASHSRIQEALKTAGAIQELKPEEIFDRTVFNDLDISSAKTHFETCQTIASHLSTLDLKIVPDDTIQNIIRLLTNCLSHFKRFIEFNNKSSESPSEFIRRTSDKLHPEADELIKVSTPWIAFLSLQNSSLATSLASLKSEFSKLSALTKNTEDEIKDKLTQFDALIARAKETAGEVSAKIHSATFASEEVELKKIAKRWLLAAGACAFLPIVLLSISVYYPSDATDSFQYLQVLGARVTLIGIFLTVSLWCGRIYKATMHQASIYGFKALALKTFQTFTAAAIQPHIKDAVLQETTRSIFTINSSGYLSEPGGGDTQVIEIMKSVLPGNSRPS